MGTCVTCFRKFTHIAKLKNRLKYHFYAFELLPWRGEEGVVGVGRGLPGEAAAQQQRAAAGRRAVRGHHLGGLFEFGVR